MQIPDSISRKHILKALESIKGETVFPPHRASTGYDLLYKRHRYPPKYVLGLAHSFIDPQGNELRGFKGGQQTNTFLEKRGFKIVKKDDGPASGPKRERQKSASQVKVAPLFDPLQLDFLRKTTEEVSFARKEEAALVKEYKKWLADQGRNVERLIYKRLQCDAYEKDRNNLIEAKSSVKREYIRMAVGQLLDYAFLGKELFGMPNMAILLPRKPDAKLLEWIYDLNISAIWKQRKTFVDNAQGQFT